ncbi:MAG: 7-carboxy-7-deazaguanine synthase QueE [candidate division WOR-3 bacterium]|nr:MAG: 7-carboxy-7-deazaguanine synthase QueE [candidate division WOR-3 bacterium]
MKGFVGEIFTSVQGEGLVVGQRMHFIRLLGCNLRCAYCDTPAAQKMAGLLHYKGRTFANPVEADFVAETVQERRVAITGGEPLVQVDFVQKLGERLSDQQKTLFLETNGSLPDALLRVRDFFDMICLDFKIPSATRQKQMWHEHARSLDVASTKAVFVKVVIDTNYRPAEVRKACSIIARVDKNIPLVIQPVFGRKIDNLLELQRTAQSILDDVRVIPQIHKYLNVR